MVAFVNLYSKNKGELNNFLSKFYNNNLKITDDNSWEKDFNNPVEAARAWANEVEAKQKALVALEQVNKEL